MQAQRPGSFGRPDTLEAFLAHRYQQAIVDNRVKLTHAIDKKLGTFDIQAVEDMGTVSSTLGIEGKFKIILTDGTEGTFTTQSIEAGGWNIQVHHFRYLMAYTSR